MTSTLDQYRQSELLKLGRSLVSNLELESVLTSVLALARELTGARYAALGVVSSDGTTLERFVTDGVNEETRELIGAPPSGLGILGLLLKDPRPIRLSNIAEHPASSGFPPNHPSMDTFLGVPILVKNNVYGNLYLAEKEEGEFTPEDEEAVLTLASWAAIAIENARSVARERLRQSIVSSEQERSRWARELHDETLQGLAALRVLLSAAAATGDPAQLEHSVREAIDQLSIEIQNLRGLITDLRPSALDELGLVPAIEELVNRTKNRTGLEVIATIEKSAEAALQDVAGSEIELTVYRLVQEALTNVAKHANAERATVRIESKDGRSIEIVVNDDGKGFDPATTKEGVGLSGMRERVKLSDGQLSIFSELDIGTTVWANLQTVR